MKKEDHSAFLTLDIPPFSLKCRHRSGIGYSCIHLRMLGPGLAISFCMTSLCVAGYRKSAMSNQVVTVSCACPGMRRTDLVNADTVCITPGADAQHDEDLEGGARSS